MVLDREYRSQDAMKPQELWVCHIFGGYNHFPSRKSCPRQEEGSPDQLS